jgi:hypothetical protein
MKEKVLTATSSGETPSISADPVSAIANGIGKLADLTTVIIQNSGKAVKAYYERLKGTADKPDYWDKFKDTTDQTAQQTNIIIGLMVVVFFGVGALAWYKIKSNDSKK